MFTPFCQRFPKFLQYIAGIHLSDSEEPFFSAVYTLPSPRTPVCRPSKYSVRHTGVFSISSHRLDYTLIEDQAQRKKKKVKVCCQENAPTISSRKRFFRKSFVALKFSPKIFLKKYCIAFSFHTVGALSFFLFFLLKNFQRSKIF